jgi:hypothetical protein
MPAVSRIFRKTLKPGPLPSYLPFDRATFFARAELSYVTASTPSGTGFVGPSSLVKNQVRGMLETRILF